MAVFNEIHYIFICAMHRELKGLGPNSCAALRKPFISEANREKSFQLTIDHEDWTPKQWKKSGQMSPCCRVMAASG